MTAVVQSCMSHYQVQGTWTTTQGKHVNYMVLREGLDETENHKIGNVYLNLGDVQACGGLLLNDLQLEASDRAHVRLVHLVAECPEAVIVKELFQDFLNSLQPLASVHVTEALDTPRLVEGRGPKIQLKMEEEGDQDVEDVLTEDHGRFSDAEPAELKFKLEEEDKNSNIKKDSANADENRLREACRLLGHPSKISTYFSLSSPLLAHCTYCNAQFSGETSNDAVRKVIDHVLVHHLHSPAYKCEMCTNTFNSREAFQEHMMDKHGAQTSRLECSLCHIAFFTKNELKCHTRTHHEPVEQGVEIKCEKCDKSFASKKTMFAHMRNVHNVSNKAVKKEKAGECVCPTCGEKKNSDHNLQQHIRKFHENAFPEPLACQLCANGVKQLRSRKYHTPYSYELHMRQIHSEKGGFAVCEYCSKEFTGSIGKVKFALKEHIQAIHMGIRKACDECGKTFISNIVLNKHKKHVHRKEGAYPCKFCGRVFKYSQQAIDHEYKDRGLAPYVCDNCPFKSADNWALAKHRKVCPVGPLAAE